MSQPIAHIQSALRDLGYDPGPVDNVFGPRTEAAADAWLDARGAPAVASASPPTATAPGPTIIQGNGHAVREIIIHCSATRRDWMANASPAKKMAEIRRWHVEGNRWSDIGYHWVVDRDGTLMRGRPETVVGAHTEGRNTGSIGICLIGGFGSSADDGFRTHFTLAQDTTLRQQIQAIGMRTPIERVSGHNEHAAKACPGFRVGPWLMKKGA
ncbi:N-acetylmuramoyl-L-alanine amidase [Tistrella bauzanensis]|uniref:N-acetylmuramoyl-L-alanine amidase n=1 Tax=Tistrella TaxID=171436 RepID=UPI0031F65DC4